MTQVAAVAQVRFLTQELPHAQGVDKKLNEINAIFPSWVHRQEEESLWIYAKEKKSDLNVIWSSYFSFPWLCE